MDGQPPLLRPLVAVFVLAGFVQDGDANLAIFGHWNERTEAVSGGVPIGSSLNRVGVGGGGWAALTVGVPHLGDELHLGRPQRVVGGERQDGSEEASFTTAGQAEGHQLGLPQRPHTQLHSQQSVLRSHDHHLPAIDVVIVHQAGREAFNRVLVQLSKGNKHERWGFSQLISNKVSVGIGEGAGLNTVKVETNGNI